MSNIKKDVVKPLQITESEESKRLERDQEVEQIKENELQASDKVSKEGERKAKEAKNTLDNAAKELEKVLLEAKKLKILKGYKGHDDFIFRAFIVPYQLWLDGYYNQAGKIGVMKFENTHEAYKFFSKHKSSLVGFKIIIGADIKRNIKLMKAWRRCSEYSC